ncbi:glycine/D-amino acid oxidase-like deaminating enzyme [Bradyrhizobium sp. USDA 3686]|uniref:hypothetical protein n=1 Tax=Bradyrhizobium canariense TaxID=255045 RepID=UPI0019565382|nr:hypothetical protein [Bradyrhizobium canariense]MBM7483349.1 glycine/D-amino acid oxidase-like deaminating enzyme [Bradyrhizobium canariense]
MRASIQQSRNQAPVINFACPAAQSGLTALIARLNAAVAEVEKWAPIEDRLEGQFRKSAASAPKVKGGVVPASTLMQDGKPDLEMPASDWFYRSRENIEKGHSEALARAETAADRAAADARYTTLLADWDAQEAAYNAARPRGLANAKRMLSKAHRAWSVSENAIVNYQPQSLAEVAEWLAYAGRDELRGVFFTPDEGHLKFMLRTASAAVAKFTAN